MDSTSLNKIAIRLISTTFFAFTGLLSFSQLTIFSDINQTGTSGTCSTSTIYAGASIPQGLNDQVSSIQLLQGYIATLAENNDGTGSSYTFVAATSNVTVNLSNVLKNKVSFIRVLPLRNTLKKGVGYTNNTYIDSLKVSWFYDWGTLDSSLASREYALMAWGRSWANNTTSINNDIAKPNVTHLLSFNEPDNASQSNIPYGEAVGLHKNLAATGYRLGSPACTENQAYIWLTNFRDSAARANVKVDFTAVHWYDWGSYSSTLNTAPDPNGVFTRFKSYINHIYALYHQPLWITEFNANDNTTSATHEAFIALALPWLESQSFVERYAYFFPASLPPVDAAHNMTAIGNVYKNFVSTNSAISRNWDNTENIAASNNAVYEAENATLIGSTLSSCVHASNGQVAAAVTGTTNKIIFHNVTVNAAGNYNLAIAYYAPAARTITVQINGNLPQVISIPASGLTCSQGGNPGNYHFTIQLNAGTNKIILSEAPIIDKINVDLLSVLPVTLLDFYATVKDRGIELNWKTAQETNSSYFELFRSKDGVNFESIARVAARGNGNNAQAYNFLDIAPADGINYYRLNQVDVNGISKTYKTITAHFGSKSEMMRLISSDSQKLLVGVTTPEAKAGYICLTGADGKILFQKNVILNSGLNQIFIPISGFSKGLGFLSLKTNTGSYTIKTLL